MKAKTELTGEITIARHLATLSALRDPASGRRRMRTWLAHICMAALSHSGIVYSQRSDALGPQARKYVSVSALRRGGRRCHFGVVFQVGGESGRAFFAFFTAPPKVNDGAVESYALGTKTKVKTLFTLTGLPLSIAGLKTQLRAASTAALRSAR